MDTLGPIAVIGSRRVSPHLKPYFSPVFSRLAAKAGQIHVGCCTGVDAALIAAFGQLGLGARLHVFAMFNRLGGGQVSSSAVQYVRRSVSAGAHVTYEAGGLVDQLPAHVRLIRRSHAVIADVGAVLAFLSTPSSSGSCTVLAAAVTARLPVVVVSPLAAPVPLFECPGRWIGAGGPGAPLDSLPLSSIVLDSFPGYGLNPRVVYTWAPPLMLPGFDQEETRCQD